MEDRALTPLVAGRGVAYQSRGMQPRSRTRVPAVDLPVSRVRRDYAFPRVLADMHAEDGASCRKRARPCARRVASAVRGVCGDFAQWRQSATVLPLALKMPYLAARRHDMPAMQGASARISPGLMRDLRLDAAVAARRLRCRRGCASMPILKRAKAVFARAVLADAAFSGSAAL